MTRSFFDDGPLDLSLCRMEPIHVPEAIQPHGALLLLREPDLVTKAVSRSCVDVLGRSPDDGLGVSIEEIVAPRSVETIREVLAQHHFAAVNPLEVRLVESLGGRHFDGIIHRTNRGAVLELEPVDRDDGLFFNDFYRRVKQAVARMQSVDEIDELCRVACDEVRDLTGLDRVMAYCFNPDWTGQVLAEAKRDGLDSFVGRIYPLTDIPEQARRLYMVNRLRLIADSHYTPSPIVPETEAGGDPIDLTHAVLRSTSPIHAEYLRQMGVRASMSISLVVENRLWGLLLCHDAEPRSVRYEVRSSCEFLGQALSWRITSCLDETARRHDRRSRRRVARQIETLTDGGGASGALLAEADDLLDLVDAAGVSVCLAGRILSAGRTLSDTRVRELLSWLAPLITEDWFASDRVGDYFDLTPEEIQVAAGVLVIQISKPQDHYLVWYRPERQHTKVWGTPPDKHLEIVDGRPRFDGDGRFRPVDETIQGRARPWQAHELRAARMLRRALGQLELQRAAEMERANTELREAAQAKDRFLATLSHELRNPLNAIVGWARLLKLGRLNAERVEHGIDVIYRNAEIQTQLIDDLLDVSRIVNGKLRLSVQPVDLGIVVREALETVRSAADAKQIEIVQQIGSDVGLVVGDADRLRQIVWNLLSNAMKFTPRGGRVDVSLARETDGVRLEVRDDGQGIAANEIDTVFERFHQLGETDSKGLGLGLSIVKGLTELHGGSVTVSSDGAGHGATFTVLLPTSGRLAATVEPRADDTAQRAAEEPHDPIDPDQLKGLDVLVVDDNADALQLLVEILDRAGASVRTAGNGEEALLHLESWTPDVVLSDIDMPQMDGYELLRQIRSLDATSSVPAAALTAYARPQDRARAFRTGFQTHMAKPLDPEELITVVASLGGRFS